jgi:hypothetical protein
MTKESSTAVHAGLYLVFVGVPLAAVLLILHVGRDVKPNMSIAGHWRADVETSIAAARACRPGWGKDHAVLEITQDGAHVELDFTDVGLRLEGVFAGGGLDAAGAYDGTKIHFTGHIGGSAKQLTIAGKLQFACPYPLGVSLKARKVP